MADKKDIADDAAPAGGGKKKLILIVLGAVLLLSLGAGGAVFFMMGGEEGEQTADGEAEVAEVEEGDPVYHAFKPPFVVSLPPGGPAGMLQVGIDVMTRTPGVVGVLEANDPMLRHHILNLLEEQQAAALMTLEGKQALQSAIRELLSNKLKEFEQDGEINGVFFTQLVLQ